MSEIPYLNTGGASKSAQTLFRELAKRGHTCRTISRIPSEKHVTVDGVLCLQTKVPEQWVNNILAHDKPNPKVILTQHIYSPWLFPLAARYHTPTILRVPSWEHFCADITRFPVCGWNCQQSACLHRKHYESIYQQASAIMSISEYVASAVHEFYGRKSAIVRPLIDRELYLVKKRARTYVTMVRAETVKGADLFIEISKRLPKTQFALAGLGLPNVISTVQKAPNIKYFGQVGDMRDVYSQTSIYLAPVVWAEPFGRTLVEAMMNGIPVIGSDRGAVPEVLGDAGIILPLEVDRWVETINRLLTDSTFYKTVSDRCRKRALAPEFNMSKQVDTFISLAESLTKGTAPKVVAPSIVKKSPKVAFFGPWIGELGWEALTWQAWCRREAKKYDKVYACSFPGTRFFYEDFAEFVSHSYTLRELWGPTKREIDFSGVKYTIPKDVDVQIWPIFNLSPGGDHIKFGGSPNKQFSCLVHARAIATHGQGFKNYPKELWQRIAEGLPKDIASIGTSVDLHVEGTVDLRGTPLDEVVNYLAGCKLIVGGSSGPMHLACLCGTPIVVWGPRLASGGSLEERYKQVWNPFKTRVEYICDDSWKPNPEEVLKRVGSVLK